jgi:hypothetical protein
VDGGRGTVDGGRVGHARIWLTKPELKFNSQNQLNLGMSKEDVTKLKSENSLSRERRYFSESVRKLIVEEIDQGLSKAEAARKYKVSHASIYKWYARYSKRYQASIVTVVEHVSDSVKVKQLEAELERMYALLGRSKAENLLLHTVIEKADEALGTDLKKNLDTLLLQNFSIKKTTLK